MKQPTRDLGVEDKACLTGLEELLCGRADVEAYLQQRIQCSLPTRKFKLHFCVISTPRTHHPHTRKPLCGLLLRLGTTKFVPFSTKRIYWSTMTTRQSFVTSGASASALRCNSRANPGSASHGDIVRVSAKAFNRMFSLLAYVVAQSRCVNESAARKARGCGLPELLLDS